jgi:hypothetical protein
VSELLDQLFRLREVSASPRVAPQALSDILQMLQGFGGQLERVAQAIGAFLRESPYLQSMPLLSDP